MGKAVGFLFFIALFFVFAIIKAAAVGSITAYKAVFRPDDLRSESARRAFILIHQNIKNYLHDFPVKDERSYEAAVGQCAYAAQRIIEENGFEIDYLSAKALIRKMLKDGFMIPEALQKEEPPLWS